MSAKGSAGSTAGVVPRRLAIEAVRRIDQDGAYANLMLPKLLEGEQLEQRDRNLVTELVYGATRMRRALDWLADRFLVTPPPPALRAALRVGAYQLAFMRIPPHAAVSATVSAAAKRNRPPVNAILRRISESLPAEWPSDAVRLSYPDWMTDLLIDELGRSDAIVMLEHMNTAPSVTARDDGYVQDLASQWVTEAVDAQPGERVLDLCAAPGGKATAMAASGAVVVGADIRQARAGLVAANAARVGAGALDVVVADGMQPPFRRASFDRVLVDAPCSGLGVLRRRADARWRITTDSIASLATLQNDLLDAAVAMVAPGGRLVYSVCTLTKAETIDVADAFTKRTSGVTPLSLGDPRWTTFGSGARLLPQDHDTDGMAMFVWTVQ